MAVTDIMPDGNGGFEPCRRLFTDEEAARYCRCQVNTIRRYITEGKIKKSRIGKSKFIRREMLDKFIENQTEN